MFLTAMEIHIMVRTLKKQKNVVFVSLVTSTCQVCFISIVKYNNRSHHYLICTKIHSVQCLYETVRLGS